MIQPADDTHCNTTTARWRSLWNGWAPRRAPLALRAAAILLLPLAATADDRVFTYESPSFGLDTRLPAGVDPASRVVVAETASFSLDTRLPAGVDPASRMVVAESNPFILDTRPPTVALDPYSNMVLAESAPFALDTRLPAALDLASRIVMIETSPFALDTRPDVGVWRNMFGFRIIGSNDQMVVVQACTNLSESSWYPLATNSLTAGTFYFLDPAWTNYSACFYRLRWQ